MRKFNCKMQRSLLFQSEKYNYFCNWHCKHEHMKFKHPIQIIKKYIIKSINNDKNILKAFS